MMELLEQILKILSDGRWHSINELISITNGEPLQVLLCLRFLEHHRFLWFHKGKVELWGSVKDFLEEIKKIEGSR